METTEESTDFVERWHDMGAASVIACTLSEYGGGQNSGHLLIQVPSDDAARSRLLAAEREHGESMVFDGIAEEGQEYLFMMLD